MTAVEAWVASVLGGAAGRAWPKISWRRGIRSGGTRRGRPTRGGESRGESCYTEERGVVAARVFGEGGSQQRARE
jgi:hypothetical protein